MKFSVFCTVIGDWDLLMSSTEYRTRLALAFATRSDLLRLGRDRCLSYASHKKLGGPSELPHTGASTSLVLEGDLVASRLGTYLLGGCQWNVPRVSFKAPGVNGHKA